jgi:hypothetical protein
MGRMGRKGRKGRMGAPAAMRAEDKEIRGEASASVRAGGGAPAPVKES